MSVQQQQQKQQQRWPIEIDGCSSVHAPLAVAIARPARATSEIHAPSTCGDKKTKKKTKPPVVLTPEEKLLKRQKHREYVRKSYDKKMTTLRALKRQNRELEERYQEMLQSRTELALPSVVDVNPGGATMNGDDHAPLMRKYLAITNVKARIQAENDKLYQLNAACMKIESRIQQLLDCDVASPFPHEPRFHFRSLPDADYAMVIARARDDILRFANGTDKLSTGSRVFGWTDQRKVDGDELKFALEKQFVAHSAVDLLARSWAIFSTPERFSKIYSSALQTSFYPLQRINDDTILFYRTVRVEGSDFIAKTVFLLARFKIDHGYMILFRSIDKDLVQFRESEANMVIEGTQAMVDQDQRTARKEMWVEKYTWVMFRETGPSSTLFHFGGATQTRIWLKEVLFIALRWETMAVGPPIMLEM